MKVSIIASANRPKIWQSFFDSLKGTTVEFEVIFAGNSKPEDYCWVKPDCNFQYIETGDIKPAQCYEIARRHATGEMICLSADDAEYPNDVIGKAYKYWKDKNDYKLILSIQTKESGYNLPEGALFNMDDHRFFGYDKKSPLMAPLAMINREWVEDLGGFDMRFICGQWENLLVMQAYEDGGRVEIFGDKDCFIDIDHLGKSLKLGESESETDFLKRPFATGYNHDRKILESSCKYENGVVEVIEFCPYEFDMDLLLTINESFAGKWARNGELTYL